LFTNRIAPGAIMEGANIRRAFITMNHPFDARSWSNDPLTIDDMVEILGMEPDETLGYSVYQGSMPFWQWLRNYQRRIREILREQGYDGIIQKESHPGVEGDPSALAYILFNSNQIKWTMAKEGASKFGLTEALEEINERFPVTPDNRWNHQFFVNGKVEAYFDLEPMSNGKLRLRAIQSVHPNSGVGTIVMQRLTRIADKYDIEMELTASPFGDDDRIGKDKLVEWYRTHGFEDEQGHDPALGYMIRKRKAHA